MTPRRYLLTAPSGAGKTTFCAELARQARANGLDVAGLLCPPVFENGLKTGIQVQDARTGETRSLAVLAARSPGPAYRLPLGQWLFSTESLAWGNAILQTALPCDLLILDELGPLEFFRGEGWQAARHLLPREEYRAAVIIVRPTLIEYALAWAGTAEILPLPPDPPEHNRWYDQLLTPLQHNTHP